MYLIFILLSILYSQSNNYGGGPNSFYKNLHTAREASMGGAGISSAEGYLANLWNPARIVDALDDHSFIIGFNRPSSISSVPNANYSFSQDWWSIGILRKKLFKTKQKQIYMGANLIHKNYKDLWETRININNEIEPVGKFNLSQSLFLLSLAGKFDDFSVGISAKMIHSDLYNKALDSRRLGLDAGIFLSFKPRYFIFIDDFGYGFVLKTDQD